MKQVNLFQIWGFKRNDVVGSVESSSGHSGYCEEGGGSSERKIVKPENCGSILHHTGKEFENTKSSRKRKGSGDKGYLKTYKGQFTAILAFRPTGWTFSERISNDLELIKPVSKRNITIYGVPYSEHSSFTELRDFVQFLKPDKIIPTVNVWNAANREKMQSYSRDWLKG
eukprot:XP_025982851.1 DNA cross-link repair protein SNM1-like [Glycine max]